MSMSVMPLGSAPVSLIVGIGKPVVVSVNVLGVPALKLALFALMKAGG